MESTQQAETAQFAITAFDECSDMPVVQFTPSTDASDNSYFQALASFGKRQHAAGSGFRAFSTEVLMLSHLDPARLDDLVIFLSAAEGSGAAAGYRESIAYAAMQMNWETLKRGVHAFHVSDDMNDEMAFFACLQMYQRLTRLLSDHDQPPPPKTAFQGLAHAFSWQGDWRDVARSKGFADLIADGDGGP